MSVNRKIGNAVQRNYIKRKMRELFRLNHNLLQDKQKYDFWVVIRKRFFKEDTQEIERLFINSLKRLNPR